MLLAINIGNSNIRFGIYLKDELQLTWILNTKPYKSKDEYFSIIKNLYLQYEVDVNKINYVVVGSVVPTLTHTICDALTHIHHKEVMVVDRKTPSYIQHNSSQMGTDIYANAVAAHNLSDKKKIIIDFGTALTFTCIDKEGLFIGVVIGPGVNTSLKSLIGETAQLHDIELRLPDNILGKETEACMQSGLIFGFLSLIEGMIDRIESELGEKCTIIATGGLGHIFFPLTKKIDIFDRTHTIKGLKMLFELNKNFN